MTDDVPVPLREELDALGLAHRVTSVRGLQGGMAADVRLVSLSDGRQVVVKTLAGAPADVLRAEAEGLAALRATGHVVTPDALAVTDRLLVLEALGPRTDVASCPSPTPSQPSSPSLGPPAARGPMPRRSSR